MKNEKLLKKVELAIKKVVNKLVTQNRLTYPLTRIENAFYFDTKPRILLLRQDRIGDLLISTSFVRILRKHLPDAEIDILLSSRNVTAKKCIERYVSNIYVLEKSIGKYIALLRKLNRRKYDLIIDLFDATSTTSAIIIKYANPIFALGIDKKNSQIYDYTVPMLNRFNSNIVERLCNLLIAFGINPSEQNLELEYPVQTTKRNQRIGINLSGVTKSRYWNAFDAIEYLYKHYPNYEIRLFYTQQYMDVSENYANKFPKLITGLCKDFDTFANEVVTCSYIITPDTSIVHLCSAFKIPVVVMYLTSPNMQHSPWYPYHLEYRAITTADETLEHINLEDIVRQVNEIIKT
ncbi:MAG: hypothetical protein LBO69_08055 [Ignavibacteria bacterium]|jgi:ADP-heptose:LPS heptosyltransferase|nr:hypothetical protein [Ignavibacteria bacterium]